MPQKETILYAHGSSYNHGCEAIVRSTCKLLDLNKEKTVLYSNRIEGDLRYHLDDIITIKPIDETPVEHNSALGIFYRLRSHLHSDHRKYYYRYFGKKQYKYLYDYGKTAISIGGDNYCYPSAIDGLAARNYWLNHYGFTTVLWGASLTPEFMTPDIIEDLQRYKLIVVREKTSFNLLREKGIKTEILCGPDPAFALDVEDTPWPDGKEHQNIIGINISPFVMELEADKGRGLNNYLRLLDWILDKTDCEVALIPHVVFPPDGSNDIEIAEKILAHYPNNKRIISIDDRYNCCQLKSLISKCIFFVGARTHATIAAYSTFVPTLVVGYSSKSVGIARDLFGTEKGYVCSVQEFDSDTTLLETFIERYSEKEQFHDYLLHVMPEYIRKQKDCVEAVRSLL